MSKIVAFTVFDDNNKKYADNLVKSWNHFHKDIPLIEYNSEKIKKWTDNDPNFFYRATPIIMRELMDEGYQHIIKIDADSLILGKLDYIFNSEYDVGTVINWNRIDPLTYGEIGLMTIPPQEYFNCGLVATRSRDFVNEWDNLCHSKHFNNMPYREQGFLNILTHYSRFVTRCFDHKSLDNPEWGFYGLIAKGEWLWARVKNNEVIIPKNTDGFPPEDVKLKIVHFAEGNKPDKGNYRLKFSQEVIQFIDGILK